MAIVGRAITIKRGKKERSKDILPKMKQRRLKAISFEENLERKYDIAISQY